MKKALLFVLLALAGTAHADIETASVTCADRAISAIITGAEAQTHHAFTAAELTKLEPYRTDFKTMCKMLYTQGVQMREIKTIKPSRDSIYASTRASIAAGNAKNTGAPMPESVVDGMTNALTDVFFSGYNAE